MRIFLKSESVFFWIYAKLPREDISKNEDISANFCPTARFLIFLKSTHLAGSISGQNIFRPNRQHLQNRPDLSKIEKNRQKMRKSDTPIISRKWPIFQKISEMCSKTPKDTHISILCYKTLFYGRKKIFEVLSWSKKCFFGKKLNLW